MTERPTEPTKRIDPVHLVSLYKKHDRRPIRGRWCGWMNQDMCFCPMTMLYLDSSKSAKAFYCDGDKIVTPPDTSTNSLGVRAEKWARRIFGAQYAEGFMMSFDSPERKEPHPMFPGTRYEQGVDDANAVRDEMLKQDVWVFSF